MVSVYGKLARGAIRFEVGMGVVVILFTALAVFFGLMKPYSGTADHLLLVDGRS
jgi:hypothetical protein